MSKKMIPAGKRICYYLRPPIIPARKAMGRVECSHMGKPHVSTWLKAHCKFAGKADPGLPEPWEVSYSPPNSDGSHKKCENCFLWSRDEKCSILPAETHVGKAYVCSYHCNGKPSDERRDLGASPLTPELVGLFETDKGTSCDTCLHYDDGKCLAVKGTPQVEAKACCARWTPLEGEKAEKEF